MNTHETINYIELPSTNLLLTKEFYSRAFGWNFQDFGPEYIAFNNAGIDGGFYLSDKHSSTLNGSVLVVLYSENLESTLEKIKMCGGNIIKPVFSFPGGKRFHFSDPSCNEIAVWSEK